MTQRSTQVAAVMGRNGRDATLADIGHGPTVARFRQLLLFSGVFNIVFASPLALPWTYGRYLVFLSRMNERLGLGGLPLVAASDPAHALLINTAGIDLALVGAVVLYASFQPLDRMPLIALNGAGRTFFALLIVHYVLAADLARIVLAFGAVDAMIGFGFLWFYARLRCRDQHRHDKR